MCTLARSRVRKGGELLDILTKLRFCEHCHSFVVGGGGGDDGYGIVVVVCSVRGGGVNLTSLTGHHSACRTLAQFLRHFTTKVTPVACMCSQRHMYMERA